MHITQIEGVKTTSAPSLGASDANDELAMADPAQLLDRYFEQALGLHEAGQWQQAEHLYLKMLALDVRQPAVNYNLGMLKWQTNAHASSLDFFQRALAADDSNPEYWITYVDALMQTGQHAHARETLMRGLEHGLQGEEVDALVNQLAKPLVLANSVVTPNATALVTDTQANRQDTTQNNLSQNGHEKIDGKNNPAKNNPGKNNNKTSASKKHKANNPKIRQAFDLMQAGKLDQARLKLNQLLKFYPAHPLIMSGLGSIALQQNKVDEGIQWLEKSLTLEANQTTALSVLSVAYFQLKRFDEALQYCDQAIALNPNYSEVYINRGNALVALKQDTQAITSYEKAIALKPRDSNIYFLLVDILSRHKQYERAETLLKQGLALKPNDAVMQTIYGELLLKLSRFTESLTMFDKAIRLDQHYANAHLSRGYAYLELRQFAKAQADFEKALALGGNQEKAYLNLAVALHKQGLIDEALLANQKVLAINPKNVSSLANQGLFLTDKLQVAEAISAYDLAIEADSRDPLAHWNKAILQLLTGDFAQGWQAYEWRWQTILKNAVRHFSKPVWNGNESLAGKTLLIYPEQGLGDYIQFCRYANLAEAHGAHVILEVPKSLIALMQSLPGNHTIVETGMPLPAFDRHCALMSLPQAFKTNLGNIPAPNAYLFAEASKLSYWAAKLSKNKNAKPRIGLVWSGGTAHKNDHHRSIPLNVFLPILHLPLEFHGLQKEIRETDQTLLNNASSVQTYTDDLHDFTDTAALIAQMDLVISVDTSVAHLAAALGKPCWILLPHAPDFRWLLGRNDSLWYSSVRLFRQPEVNNWSAVMSEVQKNLSENFL